MPSDEGTLSEHRTKEFSALCRWRDPHGYSRISHRDLQGMLLPTHTLSLQNQITALTAENKNLKEKLDPLEVKTKSQNEQVDLLKTKVRELEKTNVFIPGNSYPIGLSAIRVGQPASDIDKLFPNSNIKKEERDYWSVELDHSVFGRVTYYFSGEKRSFTRWPSGLREKQGQAARKKPAF